MTVHDITPQLVKPVIVHLPADLGGIDVLVQHYSWGVSAAVRESGNGSWTPAEMAGASVEIRES